MGLFNWWRQERPPYWAEIRALTNGTWEERQLAGDIIRKALRSEDGKERRAAVVALVSAGVGVDLLKEETAERRWEQLRPTLFAIVRECLFSLVDIPTYIGIELRETDTGVTATVNGSPTVVVVEFSRNQFLMRTDSLYEMTPSPGEIEAIVVSLIRTASDAVIAKDALSRLPPTTTYRDFKKVVEELRGMVAP